MPFGLVAGIVVGLLVEPVLPVLPQSYLLIAIVTMLDTILGGTRAWLKNTFFDQVLMVSFLSSIFIAGPIVFVGDQIKVGSQLSTGVAVALGVRIFNNVTVIRRVVFHT